MESYLKGCFSFCAEASKQGIISVMRLWNLDGIDAEGQNNENVKILSDMKRYFDGEWVDTRSGKRISDKIFLEYGERFEWPDKERINATSNGDTDFFCYGLRDQIGILCDGTVVPCCLDSEGSIPLGNLLELSFDEILKSDKAKRFYDSVSRRQAPHPLCETCGYAKRFKK